VKISFTFADEKLIVPWTVAYDAKTGQYLTDLIIKFYHDDFDVHMIDFTPKHSTDKVLAAHFNIISIDDIVRVYVYRAHVYLYLSSATLVFDSTYYHVLRVGGATRR
jgi:hypothetical protein